MKKIYLHLDNKFHDTKPIGSTIAVIHKNICKDVKHITVEKLAEALANGQTMVLGVMKDNERKKVNLNFQELVALDFDDNANLEEIKSNRFIQDNASFIYTTFSHTEEKNKFRVVFILNRRLTNNQQVEEVYKRLFEMFPNVDIACKDSSRLFFGGHNYTEINFENTLNVDDYIKYIADSVVTSIEPTERKKIRNVNIDDKPTWWLIRHGFDEVVRERLSMYSVTAETHATAMNYVKSLNMRELLGFASSGNVHDLFSKDDNPSVSIYKLQDSAVYLYQRHSNDPEKAFTGNVIQVVAKLKNTHFIGALNYLITVMNIDFNSSEAIRQLNMEIEIYTALLNSRDLMNTHPEIHKIFKDGRSNYSADLIQILQIFKNNVIEVDGDIRMISQLSSRELSHMIYGSPNKKNRISRVLNLMTTTDWIVKLDTQKMPEVLKRKVLDYQKNKNRKYHKNIFEFISLGNDFFSRLNRKCGDMLGKDYSARGTISKIGLEKTLGKSEADKVYTQDKNRNIGKTTKKIEDTALNFMMIEIDTNGYVEERAVTEYLSEHLGKSYGDYKFKQVRNYICEAYGLERTRLNKALKKAFGVSDQYTQTQSPCIFKRVQ